MENLSLEKVYRAYIPKESVKWFNRFLKETPNLDVWLFIRHEDDQNNQTATHNYSYYSEFKVHNSELVDSNLDRFNEHNIKVEVMISDFRKHLMGNRRTIGYSKWEKRSVDLSPPNVVVGKYAAFNDVFIV